MPDVVERFMAEVADDTSQSMFKCLREGKIKSYNICLGNFSDEEKEEIDERYREIEDKLLETLPRDILFWYVDRIIKVFVFLWTPFV